jgi:uncharacterized protein (TIGR03067 family)
MLLMTMCLALAVNAPTLKDKPPALDLSGEWIVARYILGGNEVDPGVHIRFAADGKATFSGGPPASTTVGDFTANLAKKPAEVDIVFPNSGAGAMIGIIKMDGGDLILCFGPAGDRPAKFESPAGTGIGLLTLKRPKKE